MEVDTQNLLLIEYLIKHLWKPLTGYGNPLKYFKQKNNIRFIFQEEGF